MFFLMTLFGGRGSTLPPSFRLTLVNLLFAMTGLILSGCGSDSPQSSATTTRAPLRIGVIPTRGVLPLFIAKNQGYFLAEGVEVEFVSFQSAVEKDVAFREGSIDGMCSDLVASTLMRSQGDPLRVVALISGGGPDEGRVAIVASPKSSIYSPADLPGTTIAITNNSIIEFVTDELLEEEQIPLHQVVKIPVCKIHRRVSMLLEDKVSAATLTEPLITYAQSCGARVILDDHHDSRCFLVLAMRKAILSQRTDDVEKMMIGYNRAVHDINTDPQRYRECLVSISKIPQSVQEVVRVCRYAHWQVPTPGQVERVVHWLEGRQPLKKTIKHRHLVDDRFIRAEDKRCAREQHLARAACIRKGA